MPPFGLASASPEPQLEQEQRETPTPTVPIPPPPLPPPPPLKSPDLIIPAIHFNSMKANAPAPPPSGCQLTVIQQPQRARTCGFTERGRRLIDPPPVVKLVAFEKDGTEYSPVQLIGRHYVLTASLLSEDGLSDCSVLLTQPRHGQTLFGTRAVIPDLYTDLDDKLCALFCFIDLSVRVEGTFRLKFTLVDATHQPFPDGTEHSIPTCSYTAEAISEPFKVYTAKKFPGMQESTELSKLLKRQGLSVSIRTFNRKQGEVREDKGD